MKTIRCTKIVGGKSEGRALVSKEAISFLGGCDLKTGVVIEEGHQLYGQSVAGTVLVFPEGKGSTVGSFSLYVMARRGVAPKAIINVRRDPIVIIGGIISGIPIVDGCESDPLEVIRTGQLVEVDADNGLLVIRGEDATDER
jgi:hypothetical protein